MPQLPKSPRFLPRTSANEVFSMPMLSRKAAFALLASAVLTLLASSSAPTPLYAIYQAHWGFSDGIRHGHLRRLRGRGAGLAAGLRVAVGPRRATTIPGPTLVARRL